MSKTEKLKKNIEVIIGAIDIGNEEAAAHMVSGADQREIESSEEWKEVMMVAIDKGANKVIHTPDARRDL